MTVQFALPAATAALTDKELEVLRLLAAGHTVKSIAQTLGKSEASINERLRDARRKTGVGSSRELARQLDAQKVWDRKIGLSAIAALPDDLRQPRKTRRLGTKGTIIMILALPIATAIGLLAMASSPVPGTSPAPAALSTAEKAVPLAGRWALNVNRIPPEERPRQVTISFQVSPDRKWTTVVEIVGPDGTVQQATSTAGLDGVPVPVTGNMAFIDTVSLRQPAPNTLVMMLGKGGTPVSTRVYTVAKNRKSMTETIVWAGSTLPRLETTHFDRIG